MGPIVIMVKHRRAKLKRWGALFTCFNTRAVHIEVVEGLDTDSFINALTRFINRRGKPEHITSDCGTNFKGTTVKELEIETSKVNKFAVKEVITWNFNPPASPHMGGSMGKNCSDYKRCDV